MRVFVLSPLRRKQHYRLFEGARVAFVQLGLTVHAIRRLQGFDVQRNSLPRRCRLQEPRHRLNARARDVVTLSVFRTLNASVFVLGGVSRAPACRPTLAQQGPFEFGDALNGGELVQPHICCAAGSVHMPESLACDCTMSPSTQMPRARAMQCGACMAVALACRRICCGPWAGALNA